eukprot:1195574-Prorocentrum_minimum.AAC.14
MTHCAYFDERTVAQGGKYAQKPSSAIIFKTWGPGLKMVYNGPKATLLCRPRLANVHASGLSGDNASGSLQDWPSASFSVLSVHAGLLARSSKIITVRDICSLHCRYI